MMKKYNYYFFFSLLLIIPFFSTAQNCTNCVTLITGLDIFPRIIPTGMKVCITSTGTLQGDPILQGGELCIDGHLTSNNVVLTSGTINNYGIMDNEVMGITAGVFNNTGTMTIDSIGILGTGVGFTNTGIATIQKLALVKLSGTTTFANSGTMTVDSFAVAGFTVNNTGQLTITKDFASSVGTIFSNTGSMQVGRDFSNTGDFYTNCMISVGRDWANAGTVRGPANTSCGGFSVVNNTANTGNFAADNSHLDMCDASGSGFDGNTGILGANVTFCTCNTVCQLNSALVQVALFDPKIQIYPNPFEKESTWTFDNPNQEEYSLSIVNASGQVVREINHITGNSVIIQKENLPSGFYYGQLKTAKLMTKAIPFVIY